MRILAVTVGAVIVALQPAWADWPTDLPFESHLQIAIYPVYGRTVVNSNPVMTGANHHYNPSNNSHYPTYHFTDANKVWTPPSPAPTTYYNNPVRLWGYGNTPLSSGYNGQYGGQAWGNSYNPYMANNMAGFNYPHWQTFNYPTMAQTQGVNPYMANSYNPWVNNLAATSVTKPLTPAELPRTSAYPVAAAIAANPLVPFYNSSAVASTYQVPNGIAVNTYPVVPIATINAAPQALIYPHVVSNNANTIGNLPQSNWSAPVPPPAPSYQGYQAFNGAAAYTNPNDVPPPPLAPLALLPPTPPAPSFNEPLPPSAPIAPEPPIYDKVFAPILE